MPAPAPPAAGPPAAGPIVLASRSPRRRALLELAFPADRLRVLAPPDPREEPLGELTTWPAIEAGLLRVAAAKRDAVRERLAADGAGEEPAGRWAAVIAADTAIVAPRTGGSLGDGNLVALGQPPADDWEATVRRWFRDHLAGRTHVAATAVAIAAPGGAARAVVRTRVTVRADAGGGLDRLIAAGEPLGRAGGLAIGGLFGTLLVERVEGSLSNVSGLPLRETLALLSDLGVHP